MEKQTTLDELSRVLSAPPSEKVRFPERSAVEQITCELLSLMLGDVFPSRLSTPDVRTRLEIICNELTEIISVAYAFRGGESGDARETALLFLSELPDVRNRLLGDARAIYEGDPAASSVAEVMLCYPGFYAIAIYRTARVLYCLGVPVIPRMMTEYAHRKTGVDIHPGASIGDEFFIDHGTGIVIGETATVGNRVKLYQGVTLGAKSFELGEDGTPIKGIKRHPDIGNNVVIYANATVLGGKTKVGDGSVIGANVWLVDSVPPGSTVIYGKNNPK